MGTSRNGKKTSPKTEARRVDGEHKDPLGSSRGGLLCGTIRVFPFLHCSGRFRFFLSIDERGGEVVGSVRNETEVLKSVSRVPTPSRSILARG